MQDRVPLYPGRVKLTPVSGQENTYDMVRADEPTQEGTPLNKASLLTDATAALFGLGSDAVPDDVLNLLSRFHNGLGNEYVWAKTKVVGTIQLDKLYGYVSNSSWTVYRSPTMSESNGVFTLDQRIQVSGYGPSGFADYVGQYFDLTNIYGSATSCVKLDSCTSSKANFYTLKLVQVGTTVGYVNSPDPNAYPPAEPDGYTYTALGQFGNKVQIETGSYVGTGTYGSANPCSLTFEFAPLFFHVLPVDTQSFFVAEPWVYGSKGFNTHQSSTTSVCTVSVSGNTISWYGDSAGKQRNESGKQYSYIALG